MFIKEFIYRISRAHLKYINSFGVSKMKIEALSGRAPTSFTTAQSRLKHKHVQMNTTVIDQDVNYIFKMIYILMLSS